MIGGETFLAAKGEAGPFTSVAIIDENADPHAAPLMFWSAAINVNGSVKQVGLIGLPPRWPVPLTKGRSAARAGEIVVDSSSRLKLGDTLPMGAHRFVVVGVMSGRTLFGGQPVVVMTIKDAQATLAGGAPVTRAFVERATPSTPPPAGLTRFTRAQAAADLERPMKNASSSIGFVMALLWLVAACIIGSVVFLSALERSRDFAVFKATGVKSWQMGMGLAMQAVILAVVASLLAIAIALALAPFFPLPVVIPFRAAVTLPLLAIAIGLVASLAGLRKTVSVDPAQAFGGR